MPENPCWVLVGSWGWTLPQNYRPTVSQKRPNPPSASGWRIREVFQGLAPALNAFQKGFLDKLPGPPQSQARGDDETAEVVQEGNPLDIRTNPKWGNSRFTDATCFFKPVSPENRKPV